MSWMRTDFDFGNPVICFVVGARELAGSLIFQSLVGEKDNPEVIAEALEKIIAENRPQLAGGSVLSINFRGSGMQWQILYTHPSLLRVPVGPAPEERLSTCFTCGAGLKSPYNSSEGFVQTYHTQVGKQVVECCSEACVKKAEGVDHDYT